MYFCVLDRKQLGVYGRIRVYGCVYGRKQVYGRKPIHDPCSPSPFFLCINIGVRGEEYIDEQKGVYDQERRKEL